MGTTNFRWDDGAALSQVQLSRQRKEPQTCALVLQTFPELLSSLRSSGPRKPVKVEHVKIMPNAECFRC
jgi:hypothetical protein